MRFDTRPPTSSHPGIGAPEQRERPGSDTGSRKERREQSQVWVEGRFGHLPSVWSNPARITSKPNSNSSSRVG